MQSMDQMGTTTSPPALQLFKLLKKPQEEKEEEEGCKTPRAEEYKIPKIENCPPAPKKMRVLAPGLLSCRMRKLHLEMKFVHVKHEEVLGLFQKISSSNFLLPSSSTTTGSNSSNSSSCNNRRRKRKLES
ncbi:hypothetical protein ZOSMA_78G00290 [Zostera marina]|uniref:Uncharacterized protein n=1 Tax=Zostera marina TaxID=29655 RepID=A0A0K9NNC7_ZOSMR|nr:hypothetical protein ZOSMA_78G00290 [Zostera marina]